MVHPVWYVLTLGVAIGTALFIYLKEDTPHRPQEHRRQTANNFFSPNDGDYHNTPCSICLNPISSNRMRLNCGHSFHRQCIDKWFSSSGNLPRTCPNCRKWV